MSMSPEMTPGPSPPDPTTPSESPPTTPLYTSPPAPTTPSPPAPYTPSTRPSSFPPSTPTPSTPAPTTPVYSSPPAPTAWAPTATPSPPAPPTPSTSPSSSPPSTPTPSTPSTPSGNSPTPPPTRTGTTRSLPPLPSSSGSPSTPSSGSSSRSSNLSTGLVVGIAIAGVVTLLALSLLFIWWKKKKRRRRHEEDYYLPPPSPPPGPKSGVYGGQQYNGQQNPPSRADNVTYPEPSPPPVPSRPLLSSGYSSTTSNSTPPFMSSSGSGFYYSVGEILPPPLSEIALGSSKSTFTYEELARATEGFSEANLLGQGGFGYVHKGILPNGKEVAVKHLKAGSGQGEREFHAEVEIISRVHHKHLVSLVGYCIAETQRMLVYEFVPNNTLEFHLHGKGQPTMDWPTRMKIALGSAKGLAYLHEDCHPKIIHRDIKAANILLDFKFEAKVADFGLAKFFPDVNTHVSTRVMGTFGYLAPEYASSGKLTDKSDVFSFGVMLLELITGQRPIDSSSRDDSLVDWARPLLTRALDDNNFDNLADPRLQNEYNHNEMARMVACAAACVRHSARRRPRISQIVRALEGDVSLSDLNEGITPRHSNIHDYGSSDYNTSQYNEGMKKFRKMALGSSTEYSASSDYSNPTSESSLYHSGSSSKGQTYREMEIGKMKNNNQGLD